MIQKRNQNTDDSFSRCALCAYYKGKRSILYIYLAFYYAIKKQKKNGDVYEDCTNRQKRGR